MEAVGKMELEEEKRRLEEDFFMEFFRTMPAAMGKIHSRFKSEDHPKQHIMALGSVLRAEGRNLGYYVDVTGVPKSNLSPVFDSLCDSGFLTREADPEDGRRVLFRATREGKAFMKAHARGKAQECAHMLDALSNDEIRRLRDLVAETRLLFDKAGL